MKVRLVSRGFSESRVRKSIFRILQKNMLCSMSTVNRLNRAHINTAYFCYSPDIELYFLSDLASVHSRNLSRNSSMAMVIFRSSQNWGAPDRGLQLFGTCAEVRGDEAVRAERLYGGRFPLYSKWLRGASKDEKRLASILRSYRFHRFLPERVKVLDEAEFGGGVFVTARVRRLQGSN